MMKSQNSVLREIENKIRGKTFLEFTVHLLDLGYFNPIVFCHDFFWFNRDQYSQILIGFINLLSYLNSCGIMLETEIIEPEDVEIELYRNIMKNNEIADSIVIFHLVEADFAELNLQEACIPENCNDDEFNLVKLYLYLKTGAALNRKAIENVIGQRVTDAEMLTIRKQIENISGKKIIKRKDNSYEMG